MMLLLLPPEEVWPTPGVDVVAGVPGRPEPDEMLSSGLLSGIERRLRNLKQEAILQRQHGEHGTQRWTNQRKASIIRFKTEV